MSVRRTITDINKQRILSAVWTQRGISRAALAKDLKLNRSSVTDITSELISLGLMEEFAQGESTAAGGRKPKKLTLRRDFGCVVGVDFRGEEYIAVAVNLNSEIIHTRQQRLTNDRHATPVDSFLSIYTDFVKEIQSFAPPVLGVGIGMSALIDPRGGRILHSGNLKVRKPLDFVSQLKERIECPIFIDKNSNCCSWGLIGGVNRREADSFLSLLVRFTPAGVAVGMSIVVDGRIHYGQDYTAGEFVSYEWNPDPELEGFFSITKEDLLRVRTDNAILTAMTRELARNAALLLIAFDFNKVVIGGDLTDYKDLVRGVFNEQLHRYWRYPIPHDLTIDFFQYDHESVAYGAAMMVLEDLFRSPEPATMYESTGLLGRRTTTRAM